jgi:hypothetical protein
VLAGAMLCTICFLSACHSNGNKPVDNQPANLLVIHGAAGVQELEFRVNGNTFNEKPLIYNTVLPYQPVGSGKLTLSINKKGSQEKLNEVSAELKNGVNYSGYIISRSNSIGILMVEDNLSEPAPGKAMVRFINISPNAGELDAFISGKPAALFKKTKFEGVTPYMAIDTGTDVVFELRKTGQAQALVTTRKVKVEPDKFYTLWAKGDAIATADSVKLALGVITNK